MIDWKRMRLAGHVTCTGKINSYSLTGKPAANRPPGTLGVTETVRAALGRSVRSCEHRNEPYSCTECGGTRYWLSDYQLLSKESVSRLCKALVTKNPPHQTKRGPQPSPHHSALHSFLKQDTVRPAARPHAAICIPSASYVITGYETFPLTFFPF
jgi:hypothetical protein